MKRTVILFLIFVLSAFAAKTPLPSGTKTIELSPDTETLTQLHRAKEAGDIDAARRLQQRIDREHGHFSPMPVSESDSRLEPVRRSSVMHESTKEFSSDSWVSGALGLQEAPDIASHSDGTLYSAFEHNDASVSEHTFIQIKRSTDGGDTWTDFFRVTNPSTNLNEPSIVVGEGDQDWVFIAYNKEDPSYVEVARIATSGMGGEIRTLETPSFTTCKNARIAVDDLGYYYVYVAYIRNAVLDTDVHFARSTDFGLTWEVSDITSEGKHYCDIAVGRWGKVYVVAQKGDIDDNGKIYLRLSTNYGSSFTSEQDISTTNKDNFPRIATMPGTNTAVMTYTYAYSSSDHDLYYSYTEDGGSTWTTSRWLRTTIRDEKYADIAAIGSGFYAAFHEMGKVRITSTASIGAGFSSVEDVSDEATAIEYFPAITASYETSSGCPAVVWNLRYSDTDYDILFDKNCCTPVSADISASGTGGDYPYTATFTDNSTGVFESREWTVNGVSQGSGETLEYNFAEPGTHTVILTVSNHCSESSDTITVEVTCPDMAASFTLDPETGIAPLTVNFTNTSTGIYTRESWTFGDGDYTDESSPSHVYAEPGTYEIRLTIGNLCGEESFVTQTITVFPATEPDIELVPAALDFGEQELEGCGELWIMVGNTGGTDLTVSSPIITTGEFDLVTTLPMTVPPLGEDSMLVRFCPEDTILFEGTLTLNTNDPDAHILNIPLSGRGAIGATPGLVFSPTSVVFDSVPQFDNEAQRITVRNTSDEPIHISGMYLTSGTGSGAFSIAGGDTFTILSDRYKYITINFNPHEVADYACTLQVMTDVGIRTIPISGSSYSSMSCQSYGSYQICSSHIEGDRVYGNIAFLNSEGDTIVTLVSLGEVGAFIDLDLGAGTGRARFHYEDGSRPTIFVGAFDLNSEGFRFRFTGTTDMLPDSIRDYIEPDSLLGMPFEYKAGIDPVVVNVNEGWWKLQGNLELKNGTRVVSNIDIARIRYTDDETEWDIADFNISLFDDVFRFGFSSVDVDGDTITANRITLKVDESLLPSTTFIDRGAFEINARSLMIIDGELINLDLDMEFPDFVIPAGGGHVALRDPKLRLVWEDGEIHRIAGGARFETPGISSSFGSRSYISCYIDFIRGEGLDGVELSFRGWSPGVPLGTTGFFLTGVSGEVRHIQTPEELFVQIGCQMKGGPSVPVLGSVVEMDPEITIDFGEGMFNLDGAVRFLEHLARGNAGLTYRTHDVGGAWGIEGYANLRAGVTRKIYIEGGTDLHIWQDTAGGFHLAGYGFVEGHLEHNALMWLAPTRDISVGCRAWYGEFRNGGDSGGHWGVKGQVDVEIFGLRPAFSYIDGHLATMEDAWNYTPADEFRHHYMKAGEAFVREEVVFDISSTDLNVFQVRTDDDVSVELSIELPDGRIMTPDSCVTDDDTAPRYYFTQTTDDGYTYTGYAIHENLPGEWTAYIDSIPAGDTDHPMQTTGLYYPLTIDGTVTPTGDGFSLEGDLANVTDSDVVFVDVYLLKNGSDGARYPVAELELSHPFELSLEKTWEEIGAKGGAYTLSIFAEDSRNRIAYFEDATILTAPADESAPFPPVSPVATWSDSTVRVIFGHSTSPDIAGYNLYKGFDREDGIWWWEQIDLTMDRSYIIGNTDVMIPDTCEFVLGLSAYDASGNESDIIEITPTGRDPEERDTEAPLVTITGVTTDIDERTATIEWETEATDIAGYILHIGTNEDEYARTIYFETTGNTYDLTHLRNGSNYYLALSAYDDYLNQGPESSHVMAFYDEFDMDGDGLPDWWEEFYFESINLYGRNDDPDDDLVTNINEYLAGTDPNSPDTDGDGVPDLSEIASGELDPTSNHDDDGDRLPDDWEHYFFGTDTITGLAEMDNDNDDLTNLQELEHFTDPFNRDTDEGGVYDGFEVVFAKDPLDPADDDNMPVNYFLSRGWNMIGVPFAMMDSSVATNLPEAIAVYRFADGAYEEAEFLSAGEGYFVLMESEGYRTIEGLPILEITRELDYGWNMVGAPMSINGIPMELVNTTPSDVILYESIYTYSMGEYVGVDLVLANGYGYWILASEDAELTMGDGSLYRELRTVDHGSLEGSVPPPPPLHELEPISIPDNFVLHGAYPNPFNSATEISFSLSEDSKVTLDIFDVDGRAIATKTVGELKAGRNALRWDGKDNSGNIVSSGMYMYRIQAEDIKATGNVLFVK